MLDRSCDILILILGGGGAALYAAAIGNSILPVSRVVPLIALLC